MLSHGNCHILTAEPHFNSETGNTHTEYLNTSSTAIYLQKMANELRSIRTYVLFIAPQLPGVCPTYQYGRYAAVQYVNSEKWWSLFGRYTA